ncbi:MAG: hypothetical protein Q8O03_01010 [Nanoarchaeota archaeon]|nr:hypothetical protein [Nanoarchaeota archaeon]
MKKIRRKDMPNRFSKAPMKLSLEGCEGVEKKKKFAVGRVIKWGLIIYCAFVFRSCLYNLAPQQPPKIKQESNIEQMLPSSLKHYDASKIEIKKGFLASGEEVYKDGMPLGLLSETNILTDLQGEHVGYLNNNGLYNSLGQYTGKLYKGDVFDLQGNKIGSLKTKDNSLESIVNGDKKLFGINGSSYVIMAKEPTNNEYKIIGIVDNYKK